MVYRPQDVAEQLGISPSTLRLWSNHFAEALSDRARKVAADGAAAAAQRRYTEEDLETLTRAKELLAQGLTYEETGRQLRPTPVPPAAAPREIGESLQSSPQLHELQVTLASLRETLEAKDRTIAALKESLSFLDVYLRTVLQEREDAHTRERLLQRELDELRAQLQEGDHEPDRPWWKRLLAIP